VHALSARKYFRAWMAGNPRDRTSGVQVRIALRLRRPEGRLESTGHRDANERDVTPVRITHTIHGRSYVIEVRPVTRERWRAQVSRTPGGMTSLMPFYGATPEAAAAELARWLARAGRPAKAG
jgi:hypothetical protein